MSSECIAYVYTLSVIVKLAAIGIAGQGLPVSKIEGTLSFLE